MCHITKFNTQEQLHKFKLESFEDFMISISNFFMFQWSHLEVTCDGVHIDPQIIVQRKL